MAGSARCFLTLHILSPLYILFIFVDIVHCSPTGSPDFFIRTISNTGNENGVGRTDGDVEVTVNAPVTLRLEGERFSAGTFVAFTATPANRGQTCDESKLPSSFKVSDVTENSALVTVNVSSVDSDILYVCVMKGSGSDRSWVHQGGMLKVRARTMNETKPTGPTLILGIRAEGERASLSPSGVSIIPASQNIWMRLYGAGFAKSFRIMFTSQQKEKGAKCDLDHPQFNFFIFNISQVYGSDSAAMVEVSLPELPEGDEFYMCTSDSPESWVHQGNEEWLRIQTVGHVLPIWLQVVFLVVLLMLSGLFSGLNLGLMALDRTELQVIAKCGQPNEQKYARTIAPLRKRGNYLLCSLLLGNVLVNTTLTILLDDMTSGLIAVIGATVGIVIFGEIIPQAICSRHGLAIGARTVFITKFFMGLTFPMSFPISKLLDWALGEEIGNVYDRERLMEYIRLTKDYNKLENEEVNIISGALELKKKTVFDVMTKIEDVFMIPLDAILNFETMSQIMKRGYTRIPVYDGDHNNIVSLLNIKDLAFVDPDDNTPLRTLCEFYNHPINFVFEDETLDVMLNEFKKGQSHMAYVRHIHTEDETDPYYEVTGVVTLEDVIEELIQSEIIDETDILTDNRRKQRRSETAVKQDFSDFAKIGGGQQGKNIISPQLALATFQYLSTSVIPFKKEFLSVTVLRRLMTQNIFFSHKFCGKDHFNAPAMTIYQSGKPADYFIMVIEGRVRVTVGAENLVFEAGPFSFFGIPAISITHSPSETASQSLVRSPSFNVSASPESSTTPRSCFIPDYTVVVVADTVYMKIHRAVYLAAHRATLMEHQTRTDSTEGEDPLRKEWETIATAVQASELAHLKSENVTPMSPSASSSVFPPMVGSSLSSLNMVSPGTTLSGKSPEGAASAPENRNTPLVSLEVGGASLPTQRTSKHNFDKGAKYMRVGTSHDANIGDVPNGDVPLSSTRCGSLEPLHPSSEYTVEVREMENVHFSPKRKESGTEKAHLIS